METEQPSIKLLPPDLINQIAAGEVVERPSSVVKELIENSIDAGAHAIHIQLVNGGIQEITVTDDGKGMSAIDARLSIVQHATSKIIDVNDLFKIQSLGFRGEALASIASVSEFSVVTRQASALAGLEVSVRDKSLTDRPIGCPVGTTVSVKNLFFNIPARKKYLKTAVTEFNHIVDLYLNYVLAYPKISWTLKHNDRIVYQCAATDVVKNRLYEVLGKEISEQLIPVHFNTVPVQISGFIGKPHVARNNHKLQFVFVNDRPVHEYIIAKQVKDAFSSLLPRDMFPVYVLYLNVDPGKIDVNVHPRKTEIRFAEPAAMYQAVYRAVGEALDHADLVKNAGITQQPNNQATQQPDYHTQTHTNSNPVTTSTWMQSTSTVKALPRVDAQFSAVKSLVAPEPFKQTPTSQAPLLPLPEPNPVADTPVLKVIGQVHSSYIVVEAVEGLRIYDQHAVSERVQYEQIKKDWLSDTAKKQAFLLPQPIEFATIEANIVQLNMPVFERLGFELSELSNNGFLINAAPQLLVNKPVVELLKEIVGQMETWELGLVTEGMAQFSEPVDRVLKMMACRSAVMFGDGLSFEEMKVLLDRLSLCENRFTCVHGRPCVVEYSHDTLKKLFKRL